MSEESKPKDEAKAPANEAAETITNADDPAYYWKRGEQKDLPPSDTPYSSDPTYYWRRGERK